MIERILWNGGMVVVGSLLVACATQEGVLRDQLSSSLECPPAGVEVTEVEDNTFETAACGEQATYVCTTPDDPEGIVCTPLEEAVATAGGEETVTTTPDEDAIAATPEPAVDETEAAADREAEQLAGEDGEQTEDSAAAETADAEGADAGEEQEPGADDDGATDG